jgi:hypothetical protein
MKGKSLLDSFPNTFTNSSKSLLRSLEGERFLANFPAVAMSLDLTFWQPGRASLSPSPLIPPSVEPPQNHASPPLVRFRSHQIGSLDEPSRLPRQSPWRRCCCAGLPGPTAAGSRWPPPPAVEPRCSTPHLPPPSYEPENHPSSPFVSPFRPLRP